MDEEKEQNERNKQEQVQEIDLKPEDEGEVNDVPAEEIPYSADWLIAKFGKEEAYTEGCKLAIEALKRGDKETAVALGHGNVELLRRSWRRKKL
jgi:hypothetical protein